MTEREVEPGAFYNLITLYWNCLRNCSVLKSTTREYRLGISCSGCALRAPHYTTRCSLNLTTNSFFVIRMAPSPATIVNMVTSPPTSGMTETMK